MKETSEEFEAYVDRAREVNTARCFKFFLANRTSNIWKAWNNVIKNLKLTKAKTIEFKERQSQLRKKEAVKFWWARIEKTKASRHAENQLITMYKFKYYRSVFNALHEQYRRTKNLVSCISNYEAKMR